MNTAFVLKPRGTAAESRHKDLLTNVITPVCESLNLSVSTAGQENSPAELMKPVVSPVFTSSVVIVDLGLPPFDPALAMEVGYRRGAGRPVVYIRDEGSKVADLGLSKFECATYDPDDSDATKAELRDAISDSMRTMSAWNSHYGILEQKLPLQDTNQAIYTYANDIAAQMLGYASADQVIGRLVSEIDEPSLKFMPQGHLPSFLDDQNSLVGQLMNPNNAAFKSTFLAKVPMWFLTHKDERFRNRLIWPVIVQHRFEDGAWFLRLALIDISTWGTHVLKPPYGDSITLPHAFCRIQRPYDLFLSYSTADNGAVALLHGYLENLGLKVWVDSADINGTGSLLKSIVNGMQKSRALAVIVGPQGLGTYQYTNELEAEILRRREANEPYVTLLLPGVTIDNASGLVPAEIWHLLRTQLIVTVDRFDPQGGDFTTRLVKFLVGMLKEC